MTKGIPCFRSGVFCKHGESICWKCHAFAVKVISLIIQFRKKTSQSYGKRRPGFVLPLIEEYDKDWKWIFLIKMIFLPFPPIIKPYINGCCFTIEPNIGILIVLGCRYTTCRPSLQVWCKNNQQVENDKGLTWNTLFWVRRFLHLFWPMWWVTSMMNFMTFAVKVKVGTIHFMKGTS